MNMKKWLFFPLLMLVIFSSCRYSPAELSGWDVPQRTKDSLEFLSEHHFTLNTNFQVMSDSLLLEQLPVKEKFKKVKEGDIIVVAEFMNVPADSIDSTWVKVARDQDTQGWIRKNDLLKQVTPKDSISQFINLFSRGHGIYFLVICILFVALFFIRALQRKQIRLVYFNDIDSIFPMLLCLLMAFSATLYGSIQTFVPETWEHFYFNPSLNPFKLPLLLAIFITSIWAIIITALATLDDLFRQVKIYTALFYLAGLASICILCYLFFIYTTSFYIGYLFLILMTYFFIKRILAGNFYKYRCGKCGAKLRDKGECPHCGAINQ